MKAHSLHFSALLVAALTLVSSGFATAADSLPITSATSGLTLSVSTSSYQMTPIIGHLISPPPVTTPNGSKSAAISVGPIIPVFGRSFVASVALINHTGEPITFTFPTSDTGKNAFDFQVFDSNGTLVWDSKSASTAADVTKTANLGGHQAWRALQFVPLFINGTPLAAGNYTLKVTLEGTPTFESTTSFVVNPPIAIN